MNFFDRFRRECQLQPQRVIFAEGNDERILQAARFLKDNLIAEPVILGGNYEIRDLAEKCRVNTRGLTIVNSNNAVHAGPIIEKLYAEKKGLTRTQIELELKNPQRFAIEKMRMGHADIVFAGNKSTMAKVGLSAIKYSGINKVYRRVSSFYMMYSEQLKKQFCFADCSMNINPDPWQLSEIAVKTAENFEKITGDRARVAFLSFSTKGSAADPKVDLIRNTLEIIHKEKPAMAADGELQFDAAIDPVVSAKKAPNGSLNGMANVFIFPSLNAANIGQKIAEQIGGFISVGPMLQGLNYPVHHLAKSCTADGIINSVLLASYMKIKNIH